MLTLMKLIIAEETDVKVNLVMCNINQYME